MGPDTARENAKSRSIKRHTWIHNWFTTDLDLFHNKFSLLIQVTIFPVSFEQKQNSLRPNTRVLYSVRLVFFSNYLTSSWLVVILLFIFPDVVMLLLILFFVFKLLFNFHSLNEHHFFIGRHIYMKTSISQSAHYVVIIRNWSRSWNRVFNKSNVTIAEDRHFLFLHPDCSFAFWWRRYQVGTNMSFFLSSDIF